MNEASEIVLVPHSGIQFVTLPFDAERVGRFDRPFIERPVSGEMEDGRQVWRLYPAWNDLDPQGEPPFEPQDGDETYSINKGKALDPFLGQWVPLPFLRVRRGRDQSGEELYDKGPTNWVRVRVVKAPPSDAPDAPSHLAVFAFDTALDDDGAPEGARGPYAAPTTGDAGNTQEFALVPRIAVNGWFLSDPQAQGDGQTEDYQAWVLAWIEDLFLAHRRRELGRPLRDGDRRFALEHAARWFAFVGLLAVGCDTPRVRFADTVSDHPSIRPVDVDLVLDIGNSRTCGLLIETYPNEDTVDLNNSMILRLRDLARPEIVHGEPFDSHVEFSQAFFGPDELSRRSGRPRAFFWPSLVRVGPEAGRLRAAVGGTAAVGGMSSPKRYLWDTASVNQPWRFPRADYAADGTAPPISRIARPFLNRNGDVISQVRKDRRLYRRLHGARAEAEMTKGSPALSYSRSSLYGLMLSEIVWQALVMVNNPQVRAARKQSAAPRRLRRIILTLPSALPTQEQRIMKSRAEGAVALLWDLMGWTGAGASARVQRPIVQVAWDEATCVQLVWLYSEISRRFGGRIRDYFEMAGQPRRRFEPNEAPRPDAVPEPSLRVASIDIGGGTTDLMITTYFQDDDRALVPVQTFREGVGVAGDDVTRAVIERCVLPAIRDHLAACGAREPRFVLNELFGGDRSDMAEQVKDQRREAVLKILAPAALALMSLYETSGPDRYETVATRRLDELVPALTGADADALIYVSNLAGARGAVDFDLRATPVAVDFRRVRAAVIETLGSFLGCLAEAVAHFGCDKLLLSGRPSRLPAVTEHILDALAVPPDRVQPLHSYRVDVWYPFRSRDNVTIGDPKTTAVVGAMLCALAERSIVNFMLQTHRLQMRSTARYVGELGSDGILLPERVLFTAEDLVSKDAAAEKAMRVHTKVRIGYRQLRHPRWITSPLYLLKMSEGSASIPKPIQVKIGREVQTEAAEDLSAVLDGEASKEELAVAEAYDANGGDVRPSMSLAFCTMPLDDKSSEYWLESGTLTVL